MATAKSQFHGPPSPSTTSHTWPSTTRSPSPLLGTPLDATEFCSALLCSPNLCSLLLGSAGFWFSSLCCWVGLLHTHLHFSLLLRYVESNSRVFTAMNVFRLFHHHGNGVACYHCYKLQVSFEATWQHIAGSVVVDPESQFDPLADVHFLFFSLVSADMTWEKIMCHTGETHTADCRPSRAWETTMKRKTTSKRMTTRKRKKREPGLRSCSSIS